MTTPKKKPTALAVDAGVVPFVVVVVAVAVVVVDADGQYAAMGKTLHRCFRFRRVFGSATFLRVAILPDDSKTRP